MKDGLKELPDDYRKPLSERYNAAYGAGSWILIYQIIQNALKAAGPNFLFTVLI
jgi:hypothetical protein